MEEKTNFEEVFSVALQKSVKELNERLKMTSGKFDHHLVIFEYKEEKKEDGL